MEAEAHEMNWAKACMGQAEASCPFEYAARLNETMLLGVVALRAGQPIEYDAENMENPQRPRRRAVPHAGVPRGVVLRGVSLTCEGVRV